MGLEDGKRALPTCLVCRPGLCSQGLGNSHLLSCSGASSLSSGSLLFLPKGRGNYSSALASWPSSATQKRGLGRGRRLATDWACRQRAVPPDQSAGSRVDTASSTCAAQSLPLQGQEGPASQNLPRTVLDSSHWGTPQSLAVPVPHLDPGRSR